jgi:hypothetical protein
MTAQAVGGSGGDGEAMGTAKGQWPWSECRRRGWASLLRLASGPTRFHFPPNLSKTGSTCKIKMDALSCSKNSQFLHEDRLEYFKQHSQFCRLQIPNRNQVKNPGTDSLFESLMNFKRDSNLLEKSDKFSKISSSLDLHKSEFSWVHLCVRF